MERNIQLTGGFIADGLKHGIALSESYISYEGKTAALASKGGQLDIVLDDLDGAGANLVKRIVEIHRDIDMDKSKIFDWAVFIIYIIIQEFGFRKLDPKVEEMKDYLGADASKSLSFIFIADKDFDEIKLISEEISEYGAGEKELEQMFIASASRLHQEGVINFDKDLDDKYLIRADKNLASGQLQIAILHKN